MTSAFVLCPVSCVPVALRRVGETWARVGIREFAGDRGMCTAEACLSIRPVQSALPLPTALNIQIAQNQGF